MINRNCATNNLLNEGDVNVRVTVYNTETASEDPKEQKNAWLEVIRDVIGGDITNSEDSFTVSISNESDEIIVGNIAGKEIPELIRIICDNHFPIRISIKSTSYPATTWIFV